MDGNDEGSVTSGTHHRFLTSGYAEDVMERNRAVGEFLIIDKPFACETLRACGRSSTKLPKILILVPPRLGPII
jgi:hypothetical protein